MTFLKIYFKRSILLLYNYCALCIGLAGSSPAGSPLATAQFWTTGRRSHAHPQHPSLLWGTWSTARSSAACRTTTESEFVKSYKTVVQFLLSRDEICFEGPTCLAALICTGNLLLYRLFILSSPVVFSGLNWGKFLNQQRVPEYNILPEGTHNVFMKEPEAGE